MNPRLLRKCLNSLLCFTKNKHKSLLKNLWIVLLLSIGTPLSFAYEQPPQKSQKAIANGQLEALQTFLPGHSHLIHLVFSYESIDTEYADGFSLQLPEGVQALSEGTTPYLSGAPLSIFNSGRTLVWGNIDGNSYFGSIVPDFEHEFQVNLWVDADIIEAFDIEWTLNGDGWGGQPHELNGTITLEPAFENDLAVIDINPVFVETASIAIPTVTIKNKGYQAQFSFLVQLEIGDFYHSEKQIEITEGLMPSQELLVEMDEWLHWEEDGDDGNDGNDGDNGDNGDGKDDGDNGEDDGDNGEDDGDNGEGDGDDGDNGDDGDDGDEDEEDPTSEGQIFEMNANVVLESDENTANNILVKEVLVGENFITSMEEIDTIVIIKGSEFDAESMLPGHIQISLRNNNTEYIPVIWDHSEFNNQVAGSYTISGEFVDLPYSNPLEFAPSLTLLVLDYFATVYENFNTYSSGETPEHWNLEGFSVLETQGVNHSHRLSANISAASEQPSAFWQAPVVAVEENGRFTFDYRVTQSLDYPNNPAPAESFLIQVWASVDAGNTYQEVLLIDPSNHIFTADYATQKVNVTPYEGELVLFKIEAISLAGNIIVDFDNIKIGDLRIASFWVSDSEDQPIENVIIQILNEPEQSVYASKHTQENGFADFEINKNTSYTYTISKNGFITQTGAIDNTEENTETHITLLEYEYYTVRASILNNYPFPEPVGEAQISLMGAQNYSTTSNDTGQFEIPEVQQGEYTLSIFAQGFDLHHQTLIIPLPDDGESDDENGDDDGEGEGDENGNDDGDDGDNGSDNDDGDDPSDDEKGEKRNLKLHKENGDDNGGENGDDNEGDDNGDDNGEEPDNLILLDDIILIETIVSPFNLSTLQNQENPGDVNFLWNQAYQLHLAHYDENIAENDYRSFFQNQNNLYGSIYDISNHEDAHVFQLEFHHKQWGQAVPDNGYEFAVYLVDMTNGQVLETKENLFTQTFNGWENVVFEQSIDLQDITHLGVFIRPLGHTQNNAYPSISADGVGASEMSVVAPASDPSQYTINPTAQGDFVMRIGIESFTNEEENDAKILQAQSILSKSFNGFKVFLDGDEIEDNWMENNYLFEGLTPGTYTAGVQSFFTTGSSEIVSIEFSVAEQFTVSYSVVGTNGSLAAFVDDAPITSGTMVENGKSIVFEATPDTGFLVKEWTVNGEVIQGGNKNPKDEDSNTFTGYTYTHPILQSHIDVGVEFVYPEETQEYSVEFNFNLSQAPNFNPNQDDVYVTGSFWDFLTPGSDDGLQKMERIEGTMTWTKTVMLEAGMHQYRYFINAGDNAIPYPEASNLAINVTGDMVKNDQWGGIETWTSNLNESLQIFPNPASAQLHVYSQNELKRISLHDMHGRQVKTQSDITNTQVIFDVSDLSEGFYLLYIQTKDGYTKTKKISIIK